MLDYNVPGGKLNRGMAVYEVLVAIKGAEVIATRAVTYCNPNVVYVFTVVPWLLAELVQGPDLQSQHTGMVHRMGKIKWLSVQFAMSLCSHLPIM